MLLIECNSGKGILSDAFRLRLVAYPWGLAVALDRQPGGFSGVREGPACC